MKKVKMNCVTISFRDKSTTTIIHNLPKSGLNNIYDAIVNWQARTREYTAQSLCDYINSKNSITGHIAFPKSEYDKSQQHL